MCPERQEKLWSLQGGWTERSLPTHNLLDSMILYETKILIQFRRNTSVWPCQEEMFTEALRKRSLLLDPTPEKFVCLQD